MLDDLVVRWSLKPAGKIVVSPTSALLPVSWQGEPAMLKLALIDEERRGNRLMEWLAGEGAARVYASEGDALLMERAMGTRSLAAMSSSGEDDEATRIICSVVRRLHGKAGKTPPDLVPLDRWFEALRKTAGWVGALVESKAAAERLLANPRDVVALHGDIHHCNILDFGERGWLAIDPKGLIGERGFDYANLFCNPDDGAADPSRFNRRMMVVAEEARLDRARLLDWILAWAGLSAAFHIEDGEKPDAALKIAELAAAGR